MSSIQKISELISSDKILAALDLLDLDESIIDSKLDKLIKRNSLETNNLECILIFLKYKFMICIKEETDCDNDVYVNFALGNLLIASDEQSPILLNILTTSLSLNSEKMPRFAEHILQQLISTEHNKKTTQENNFPIPLKIIDCVLELCIRSQVNIHPLFLHSEFEKLMTWQDKLVATSFYSNTVPMIIKTCQDYSILNMVWDKISSRIDSINIQDLVILCTLSDFYLPLKTENSYINVKSSIIKKYDFWKIIQYGFIHEDYSIRKCSVYLARRALHCATDFQKITVNSSGDNAPLFSWVKENKNSIENSWSALFTLLETLEEKQSHLVLPALKLFDHMKELHCSWYYCALVRALLHDSDSVVQQTVEISLKSKKSNQNFDIFPFNQLLTALNNTYLFENFLIPELNNLKAALEDFLTHEDNFERIIKHLGQRKLSPIPKFFIFFTLTSISKNVNESINIKNIIDAFFGTDSSIPNVLVKCALNDNFIDFILSNSTLIKRADDLLNIINVLSMNNSLVRGNRVWKKMKNLLVNCNSELQVSQNIISKTDPSNLIGLNNFQHLACLLILLVDSNIIRFTELIDIINNIFKLLLDSQNREYASHIILDKNFNFLISITDEIFKIDNEDDYLKNEILQILGKNKDILLNYLQTHLRTESRDIDQINQYLKGFDTLIRTISDITYINSESLSKIALNILKLNDSSLSQRFFSISILSKLVLYIHNNKNIEMNEKSQLISPFFEAININISGYRESHISDSLIMSKYNKAKIEIYIYHYTYLREWNYSVIKELYKNVLELLDVGGHGCLLPIIHLSHLLFSKLKNIDELNEMEDVLEKIWNEIFDLRKNEQFKKCIKAFIEMVFQVNLLSLTSAHPLLQLYLNKIFEIGEQVPNVIYDLTNCINKVVKDTKYAPFILMLNKALVFGVVLRKDQRIENEICDYILRSNIFTISEGMKYIVNPVPFIRMATLNILCIQNQSIHNQIAYELINSLETTNKFSNRYHGNSLQHRLLLRSLQYLLFSSKIYPGGEYIDKSAHWCIQRLIKQPHHISCRIMIEWYIALYIINKNLPLNINTLNKLNMSEVPQISYFMIVYHIVKDKIITKQKTKPSGNQALFENDEDLFDNFNFAMQTFLPHTMGQLFNIRLHAQYLTLKLNQLIAGDPICKRYEIICQTIKDTFELSATEKNLHKIKNDFYVNNFDITKNLTIKNIYHHVPRLTNVTQDEWVMFNLPKTEYRKKYPNIANLETATNDLDLLKPGADKDLTPSSETPPENISVNIQRKFIPWKNMLTEMGIETQGKAKNKNDCNLIVVASLIDRLPNLGGLARTCEVFGVKNYIINSLRHLQDRQFQTLSVSSEKWLNVIEKRPGLDLKKYLIEMKGKGYSIVGAEQTSSSISLNSFKFPKETLLLMGHEKEGVPCDLLSLMDYCVEIPQHGMVRSLNVHVTASIFIWEYIRQHPL